MKNQHNIARQRTRLPERATLALWPLVESYLDHLRARSFKPKSLLTVRYADGRCRKSAHGAATDIEAAARRFGLPSLRVRYDAGMMLRFRPESTLRISSLVRAPTRREPWCEVTCRGAEQAPKDMRLLRRPGAATCSPKDRRSSCGRLA